MGCDTSKPRHHREPATPDGGIKVIGRRGSPGPTGDGGKYGGSYKIVILGNIAVGKTCILQRFADGTFQEEHAPTVPASHRKLRVGLGPEHNDRMVSLHVWDTAGQERFHEVGDFFFYCPESAAFCISFNVSWIASAGAGQRFLSQGNIGCVCVRCL